MGTSYMGNARGWLGGAGADACAGRLVAVGFTVQWAVLEGRRVRVARASAGDDGRTCVAVPLTPTDAL